MSKSNSTHWDTIYSTKESNEVSWTQEIPQTALDFIHSFQLKKTAKIIDIGGGSSRLVDYLLDEGFENISVLDISVKALEKAKKRLGAKANKVNWIVSDITNFQPETIYNLWHDRAAFHFLTSPEEIEKYRMVATKAVKDYMIIGTFSEKGPQKCSGLDITQYSETSLAANFKKDFKRIQCLTEDHVTPFSTVQNFVFCSFQRKE